MLRHFKKLIKLLLVIMLIALAHWGYLYWKNQNHEQDKPVSDLAKNDAILHYNQTAYFIKNFPAIANSAIRNDDKVKRGQMNALAKSLDLYISDHDRYPASLKEVSIDYIEASTDIFKNPDFKYTVSEDGAHYKMSIPLKNGDLYALEK